MDETPQSPQSPAEPARPSRRRFLRRAAVVTAVTVAAAGIGLKAFAHGGGGVGGWHRGGFMGATLDPAKLDRHLDRMLAHIWIDIEATEAQKQQLTPIVKSAARDLLAVRPQLADGHRRAAELLSQPTIDRAQLETLRAGQVRLVEEASRRLTDALADVAEALTPEQRARLAEHIGRFRGHTS
jgi:periplasmic protein CpxP/Spy